ncbi:MAG: sarcosine oxidase subunit gamma [Rhizobiaceae bacterium]|nr:sarcosine oxidase subunit gamma [Rhizobiaceae bacterium]
MAKRAQPTMPSASAFSVPSRAAVLAGRMSASPAVTVTPGAQASRISLRAPQKSRTALSRALGLKLPDRPKATTSSGSRTAIWLGPDEWLVIDDADVELMTAVASVKALHSAVDVSHRNQAIMVAGPNVEATLNAGCPLDLSETAFPVGAATRTVLGKAEIVLWRTDTKTFRVECWRSFADYCFTLLAAGARDAAM